MSTLVAILLGAWIGVPMGFFLACLCQAASRRPKAVRHIIVIENNRRDDGARLLGQIEDEWLVRTGDER
jgi:hypothetical protein